MLFWQKILEPSFCLLPAAKLDCDLTAVLAARDRRQEWVQAEAAKGRVSLCLKLNLVGSRKRGELADWFFVAMLNSLRLSLDAAAYVVLNELLEQDESGASCLFSFALEARELKYFALRLEAEPWGRLIDLDVYEQGARPLSRTELGLAARSCLLCPAPASLCGRAAAHELSVLQTQQNNLLSDCLHWAYASLLGYAAERALLFELSVSPKPGLVDRFSSGSHSDMNFYTFLESDLALQSYWQEAYALGRANDSTETCFHNLRHSALAAEKIMYGATATANTHKGLIFSLGLLLAAAARVMNETVSALLLDQVHFAFPSVPAICQEAAQLAAFAYQAEAERLCLCGQSFQSPKGARLEAVQAFANVRQLGLPYLRSPNMSKGSPDEVALKALLALLSTSEDKNILRRGSKTLLQDIKREAAYLLTLSGADFAKASKNFKERMQESRLSPGGAADLLALSFFLLEVENCHAWGGKSAVMAFI